MDWLNVTADHVADWYVSAIRQHMYFAQNRANLWKPPYLCHEGKRIKYRIRWKLLLELRYRYSGPILQCYDLHSILYQFRTVLD